MPIPILSKELTLTREQRNLAFLSLKTPDLSFLDFEMWPDWKVIEAIASEKLCGGGAIDECQAKEIIERFNGAGEMPKKLFVSKEAIDRFNDEVVKMVGKPGTSLPVDYELGIRFHVGKDASGNYNAVMTTMCGPQRERCAPRSHFGDFERTFFKLANKEWFGLAYSGEADPVQGVWVSLAEAKQRIAAIDKSGVKFLYFLEQSFLDYIVYLVRPYKKLQLEFGRTEKGHLTVVLKFLDEKGVVPYYRPDLIGITATGIAFDQADLIPPPYPPYDNDTDIDPK